MVGMIRRLPRVTNKSLYESYRGVQSRRFVWLRVNGFSRSW